MIKEKVKAQFSYKNRFNRPPLGSIIFTEVKELEVCGIFSVQGGNISVNLGAMRIALFLSSL